VQVIKPKDQDIWKKDFRIGTTTYETVERKHNKFQSQKMQEIKIIV
jgi:hypothetical protein